MDIPINSVTGPLIVREWLSKHDGRGFMSLPVLAKQLNLDYVWLYRISRGHIENPEWRKLRRLLDTYERYPYGVPKEKQL